MYIHVHVHVYMYFTPGPNLYKYLCSKSIADKPLKLSFYFSFHMYVCMYIAYCAYGFEYVENALSDLEVRQRMIRKRPQPFLKGFGGVR